MKYTLLATIIGSALLTGCASSPSERTLDMLEEKEERRLSIQQEHEEREQERREAEIDATPDWVLSPPPADGTGIYAVGMAESKKLSHGMKAARLQAEFQLAKMYKQELSGSERAFEQGDSEGNVTAQTTFLIDKLVDAVPIVGYEVIEQRIEPMYGKHVVYVLLKLPYDEFNKVLQQQRAETLDKKVLASFDDLERRLDKRRAQKEAEAEAEFNREQEALKTRSDLLSGSENDDDVEVESSSQNDNG